MSGIAALARIAGVAALAIGLACQDAPTRSAKDIEGAVASYLASRTDLNLGEVHVKATRIRYDGDRAVASVSITAAGDPQAVMTMLYELQMGPSGWEVTPPVSRSQEDGFATGESLPPGHPPLPAPREELPPGHPPLNGGGR
ncbi:MAG: hypothetical protein OXN89_11015 [Bryobacterales bacterium]|nr:hypothetical protein [Bryobacterales bacterium]